MNKKLKAAHSHFLAQRDLYMAELDNLLNSNVPKGEVKEIFGLFRHLALTNTTINTIEAIMRDNQYQSEQGFPSEELMNLDELARKLEDKLKKSTTEEDGHVA